MKQEISVLMDGEMFEDDAEAFLDKLKRHPEARADWATYHLIGDALRQPDHVHRDLSASFRERLQAEPTVLAPRSRQPQKIKQYAFSVAASIMALSIVAWMSMQINTEPTPQMASVQNSSSIRPASFQSNDYLMAHQEVSPSADVQGAATYIHTVAEKE
ncbi:MAG: sigma-E factor negative regulatory protein [Sideroxydans sp.]|nr:sigma-E factor negative regulatory protein [Sideroxydans sp.]